MAGFELHLQEFLAVCIHLIKTRLDKSDVFRSRNKSFANGTILTMSDIQYRGTVIQACINTIANTDIHEII